MDAFPKTFFSLLAFSFEGASESLGKDGGRRTTDTGWWGGQMCWQIIKAECQG